MQPIKRARLLRDWRHKFWKSGHILSEENSTNSQELGPVHIFAFKLVKKI